MPGVELGPCDDALRSEMVQIFAAGCVLTLLIIFRLFRSPRPNGVPSHAGLQLSYLAGLWIIHWAAMPVYFLPWYCGENPSYTLLGARQSLYGLLGFAIGTYCAPWLLGLRNPGGPRPAAIDPKLRNGILGAGIGFYFLASLLAGVTGISAITTGGQTLAIAGVVLNVWEAVRTNQYRSAAMWVLASLLFPLYTMVNQGFLGFGIDALMPIALFALTCMGRRNLGRICTAGVIIGYLGLSLCVNYLRDRNDLRRTVWGEDTYSNRFAQLEKTFANFEWFSPSNPQQMENIDGRLNQNYLVGAAVVYIDNTREWAAGKTLWNAVLAAIPRVLWPDKPPNTSGSLVSQYTGLHFAAGTSVGIGHIMELYVNFGTTTVFLGLLLFGIVLGYLDNIAMHALVKGEVTTFLSVYLVGTSMQQVGGSLAEMIGSVAACILLGYILRNVIARNSERRAAAETVRVSS